MKRLVMAFTALAFAGMAAGDVPQGERRMMWMLVGWTGVENQWVGEGLAHDWDREIGDLRELGFTDAIVQMQRAGVAAYASPTIPNAPLVKTFGDQFQKVKAACRKHGLKFHAWRACNRTQFATDAWNLNIDHQGRRLITLYKGRLVPSPSWLCPTHPANVKAEIDAMLELAAMEPDAIHYDYTRYENANGCFCERCRALFETEIGKAVNWPADVTSGGKQFARWNAFRIAQIERFLKPVAEVVHAKFPHVEISSAVQASTNLLNAQDWGNWTRKRYFDTVVPMDYKLTFAKFKSTLDEQDPFIADVKDRCFPGIGIRCGAGDIDAETAAAQIREVRARGYKGFAVFAYTAYTIDVLRQLKKEGLL